MTRIYRTHVGRIARITTVVLVPFALAQTNTSVYPTPGPAFISYSIELSSFVDYAGNNSAPNDFSYNLLNNLGNILGTKPYVRVGGNTQDFALYNASLQTGINGTFDPSRSNDYPTTIYIGPSFFESYNTWPGVKFSHGFNLAKGATSEEGWQTLVDTAPLACKALGDDKYYAYEYGNEPNNYVTPGPYAPRPTTWKEDDYIKEWLAGSEQIVRQMQKCCPQLTNDSLEFMAPSCDLRASALNTVKLWQDGLDSNNDIRLLSSHKYVDGATSPGVTLQYTLMNHTRTKSVVDGQVSQYKKIIATGNGSAPLIFGEVNSLYNQGAPGLSNSFGAALWGVDFALYAASAGFVRLHFHQGTNYRYQSWQPIQTEKATKGTKAPYYGNIAAAYALGNVSDSSITVSPIPQSSTMEAAYAIYQDSTLKRIMVINMHAYNSTVDGQGLEPLPKLGSRPSRSFSVNISDNLADNKTVQVQRLMANGSDAITGISFDGWSYNYELDNGKPVRLGNVTTGEVIHSDRGVLTVQVPDSSAALLLLK